jgi:hypothetical protein
MIGYVWVMVALVLERTAKVDAIHRKALWYWRGPAEVPMVFHRY